MPFTLILGGARSGKSALASRLAVESGEPVLFIATAEPRDDEMAVRIQRHRADRPATWRTVEAPLDIQAAIMATSPGDFLVLDCLTLWISNLLEQRQDPDGIRVSAEHLAQEMAARRGVVVSNEVGLGIVPANELARVYRDVLGTVNVIFARFAERAFLMVAGRALELGSVNPITRQD
jgi:adenosyl cobinamide kinase/adenosyl cobinamide phosphate guanylyltransferase